MKRTKPASKPVPPASPTGFAARLGALKKPIVAVASVGAVLSGLVGYYTTYKAVANVESKASAPSPATAGPSVAVLPFVDMSQAKDQEYFSDGIAEELLNLLAKVPQLQVISRTSSFSFKGKSLDIKDIANKLQVAHVLEGSVRRSGDSLRITVQLIRARDSVHLWSETYDRKVDDVFKIQDEIAAVVVDQLKVKLLGAPPKATAVNAKAYTLILQGNYVSNQHTAEASNQAIGFFKQALDIAPDAASAWTGLALAYKSLGDYGYWTAEQAFPMARQAASKAAQLDPNHAVAESMLGWLDMIEHHQLDSATKHFERAMALEPNNPEVLALYSALLFTCNKLPEAVALRASATALDPANPEHFYYLSVFHYFLGQWQQATEQGHIALGLSPQFPTMRYFLGMTELAQGRVEAAHQEMLAESTSMGRDLGLAITFHAIGKRAESDAALAKVIREHEKDAAINIASAYAYRGQADEAFAWINKAMQYHDSGIYLVLHDPVFKPLHKDPRWLAALEKIGAAPEQLAGLHIKLPKTAASMVN